MRRNHVKHTLQAGGAALGTMVFEFNTTGVARIAEEAGADFVLYDMEHTGWSLESVRMLMASAHGLNNIPLVRVPAADYHFIARVLDMGAMGVMVPMVESAEQAERIARAAHYPPQGRRGAAFGIAHDNYAAGDVLEKIESANSEVLVIAQIETATGLDHVEVIAAVEGVDVLWIGQTDLTNSLGIPWQLDHPRFHAAVERVVAAAEAHGKATGLHGAEHRGGG